MGEFRVKCVPNKEEGEILCKSTDKHGKEHAVVLKKTPDGGLERIGEDGDIDIVDKIDRHIRKGTIIKEHTGEF